MLGKRKNLGEMILRPKTCHVGSRSFIPILVVILLSFPFPIHSTTQSFQDGVSPDASYAGTRDTYLDSNKPDDERGSKNEILIDGRPDYGTLLKWDVSAIPSGNTVQSASITLTVFNATSHTYELYEMKRDWVESQATWNKYASGSNWETAGAQGSQDRGSTVLGTVGGTTGNVTIQLNSSGVALVQSWIDNPSSNFGITIQDYHNASDGMDFRSSEYGTSSQRPKLTVVIATPGTVESRVSAGNDDAEEQNPPNGNMSLTSSDLELIRDGSTDQEVGIRFNNITIPQGATITNAYVQFTVDETGTETTNLIFYGEDIDNAPTFSSAAGDITGRTKTSASVNWNDVPAWNTVGAAGSDQRTPDLSSIIQEIVDRPGWSSGNSVVIIVDGTGRRTAESYNGVPGSAPLLHAEYTAPPIAEWYLDELYWDGTSGEVADSSGNENHGTAFGATIGTGLVCNGGVFDGDDYVAIPEIIPSQGTIEFWLKPTWDGNDGNGHTLFDASYDGKYFFIDKNSSNELRWWLEDVNDTDMQLSVNGTFFTANNWYHIVVTWQYNGSGPHKIFVNGSEVGTQTFSISDKPTLWSNPRIGYNTHSYMASENGTNGTIDEVRIYNGALSASEIQTHYNNQLAGKNVDGSDRTCRSSIPIAEWRLDECDWEGTSDEVADNSGNGYHGTTYGGAKIIDGQVCNGGEFDGNDDYVALDMYYDTAGQISELTACGWIKVSPGGGGWSIVDFDRSEYFNLEVGWTNRSKNFVNFATATAQSGRTIHDLAGTINVRDGNWHFVCGVYDGTDKIIYVDGVEDIRATNAHGGWNLGTGTKRYGFIGDGSEAKTYNGDRNQVYFKGQIDEVQIYDQALSESEIQTILINQATGLNADGSSRTCVDCDPIAEWRMDECAWDGTSGEVSDSSGNNLHATTYNGTQTEEGQVCRSGVLDGIDDYIKTANTSILGGKSQMSVALWANFSSTADQMLIEIAEDSDTQSPVFSLDYVGNLLRFQVNDGDGDYHRDSHVWTPVADQWYHIAATFNQTKQDKIRLFVDGSEVSSFYASSGSFDLFSSTSKPIIFGKYKPSLPRNFNGQLDEVRLYEYALSGAQVSAIKGATHDCFDCGVEMVAFWPMDECIWNGTSGEVADSSGSTLNATAQGGATTESAKLCYGGSFDGSDDYLLTNSTSLLGGKSQMSVAFWVSFNGTGDQTLIHKAEDSDTQQPAFKMEYSDGKLRFSVYSSHADYYKEQYSWNPTTSIWYHVSATFDNGSTNKIKLYIDGSEVSSTEISAGTFTSIRNVNNPIIIGKDRPGDPSWFDGKIDEVKIYTSVLSGDDIMDIVDATRTCTNCELPDPVAWWQLDECEWTGASGEVVDSSGSGHNGTSFGNAFISDGKVCKGGVFDGNNDYIDISMTLGSTVTISAWAKSTASTLVDMLWCIDSDNRGPDLFFYAGKISLNTWDSANNPFTSIPSDVDQWHHYVTVIQPGNTKLYIDGVLSGTAAYRDPSGSDFHISSSAGYDWEGTIDEVRIYDEALTSYQIQTLYAETHPCPDCTPEPVAWWQMDECTWSGSTGEVADSSGNGNNGTAFGSANTGDGKVCNSGVFDGDDDYVDFGDPIPPSLDISGAITISLWMKPASLHSSWNYLMRHKSKFEFGFYNKDVKPRFKLKNDSGKTFEVEGDALETGQWHHIAGVRSGSFIGIYVDGVLVDSRNDFSGDLNSNSEYLRIGGKGSSGFNGSIDEVYIYDRGLSKNQIQTIMTQSHPCPECEVTREFEDFPKDKWVLMGAPVQPDPADALSVLGDDFSDFDWYVYRWNTANVEYESYWDLGDDFPKFSPGLGFWVIQTALETATVDMTGVKATDNYSVDLVAPPSGSSDGYNMMANPYTKVTDWSEARVTDGTETLSILGAAARGWINSHVLVWNHNTEQYETISPDEGAATDTLSEWEGFWVVQMDDSKDLDLIFKESTSLPKRLAASNLFVSRFGDELRQKRRYEQQGLTDWSGILYLHTQDGAYSALDNQFGVHPNADDGFDGFDAGFLSPQASAFGALYFDAPDGSELLHDIRDPDWDEKTWHFKVWDYNVGGSWVLRWPNVASIPGTIQLSLESPQGTVVVSDLRQTISYDFTLSSGEEKDFYLKANVQDDSQLASATFGFVQNPGVTKYLDLYMFPDEPLDDMSLFVDEDPIPVSNVDQLYNVYRGSIEMFSGGEKEVVTHMIDLASNLAIDTLLYNFALAGDGGSLVVYAPDDHGFLSVPAGLLPEGSWVGLGVQRAKNQEPRADDQELGTWTLDHGSSNVVYSIQPFGLSLPEGTELVMPVRRGLAEIMGSVGVFRKTSVGWESVPSTYNQLEETIHASVRQSGLYKLMETSERENVVIPTMTTLMDNYPNPFNAITMIPYTLQEPGYITVRIYDLLGREVVELVHEHQNAGYYQMPWNGRDRNGKAVSSGVYLVHFKAGSYMMTKKLMLLK